MTPFIYLRYLFLPAMVIAGSLLGGAWNFMVPLLCFGIHPLVGIMTKDSSSKEEAPLIHSPNGYRLVALIFVPVLIATTTWMIFRVSTQSFSALTITGMILSTGIMNGIIGFTLAHEFIHRNNRFEKMAGLLLLVQNNYLHYSVEHIGGHHVYACTQEDPHTARVNESIYHFLARAFAGTFRNAWKIEARRLKRKNLKGNNELNRIIVYMGIHLVTLLAIVLVAGWLALAFFTFQSIVAITLLHVTNYLQHYGLMRVEKETGDLEKINSHHAWKARKGADGLNLFQLENHADHHMHPNRTYELLSRHDDSPEMPGGYSGMILLAFVPPLWFRVMNKQLNSIIT